MTTTRTVPEFTNAVKGIGILGFLVLIGLEVIGMTGCTIRYIGRCRPGHYLAVASMTGSTQQVTAVISRIGRRIMPEINRNPAVCGMALITLQAGNEMAVWFSCCLGPVMAA